MEFDKPSNNKMSPVLFSFLNEMYMRNETHPYHNINHIQQMFKAAKTLNILDPMLYWCIWFHDLHYIPGDSQNEEKSAYALELAVHLERISKNQIIFTDEEIIHMKKAILVTKKHEPYTLFESILCDLDLSILASDVTEYQNYFRNVRQEYTAICSLEDWNTGRRSWIQNMINKPFIFSGFSKRLFEEKARKNLEQELKLYV